MDAAGDVEVLPDKDGAAVTGAENDGDDDEDDDEEADEEEDGEVGVGDVTDEALEAEVAAGVEVEVEEEGEDKDADLLDDAGAAVAETGLVSLGIDDVDGDDEVKTFFTVSKGFLTSCPKVSFTKAIERASSRSNVGRSF